VPVFMFLLPAKVLCTRERTGYVFLEDGVILSHSLSTYPSYFLFSYSFSCALFLLVLLILGFFKIVCFRVFWG
jgi:hypothetical protein